MHNIFNMILQMFINILTKLLQGVHLNPSTFWLINTYIIYHIDQDQTFRDEMIKIVFLDLVVITPCSVTRIL